jgi:hypothetical protein
LHLWKIGISFNTVFHRILDFKTGLNFYSGPFFILGVSKRLLPKVPVKRLSPKQKTAPGNTGTVLLLTNQSQTTLLSG